jgi:hypothetical protein
MQGMSIKLDYAKKLDENLADLVERPYDVCGPHIFI